MDEPDALWIPSGNFFPDRSGHTPSWIIIHGTAGFTTAQDVAYYFQKADVSSHYVIGQDGTVVQCVSEKDGAWANGGVTDGHDPWWSTDLNPNNITVSIEHVKPSTDNSDQLTQAQQDASFRLIQHICERLGIPKRWADAQGGITGHYSMDPVNRSHCPGPYPWDALFTYLGGTEMLDLSNATVANYFTDAGNGRWQCKQNSFTIFGGILDFYRRFGGTGLNGLTHLGLPLGNEVYPHTGVAIQHFERGIIAYDPNHTLDNPPGSGAAYVMQMNEAFA